MFSTKRDNDVFIALLHGVRFYCSPTQRLVLVLRNYLSLSLFFFLIDEKTKPKHLVIYLSLK